MPLQSSGIIVVDKSPIIAAATGSSSSIGTTSNSSCRSNPPQGLGGGGTLLGLQSSYNKQQQFHEWNENDETSLTHTNSNNNLMRRHQRTISSSSTSSSTSSQNAKALTITNQNYSPMNQINQSQQHHHHTVYQSTAGNHTNQVIVSEEYIEHPGYANATNVTGTSGQNVINLTTTDILNQTQILKLVSDGNGGNMLVDTLGNGNPHHGNQKIVLSNLVLTKPPTNTGQQQQTINFVNTKTLPYLTATKNQTTGPLQKIVNIPMKANNLVKSPSSQMHPHHINNSNIPNSNPSVMQKVSMQRNVQVMPRVQAITAQSTQQQRQQLLNQQKNALFNQVFMTDKDGNHIVTTTNQLNNVNSTFKKQNINQTVKSSQQHKQTVPQQVKTFVSQQQTQYNAIAAVNQNQNVNKIKSQKVVRQFNTTNCINGNTGLTLAMQNQHQPRQNVNTVGTYTINSGKMNNISVPQHNSTTKFIAGNTVKASITTVNPNTKYLMQNHMVLPACSTSSPSGNQHISNKICNTNNNNNVSNNIGVQHQIINTLNNTVCGTVNNNTGSSTIKFVNSHGAVIHSQHHPQSTGGHQSLQQQHQKIRNNNVHHNQQQHTLHISPQNHQSGNQPQFISGGKAVAVDNILLSTFVNNNNTTNNIGLTNAQHTSTGDDIMIVNGTQMTDELSARILQSMSQKSIYNNNQRQQQQHLQQLTQHKIITAPSPTTINTHQGNIILSSTISRDYSMFNSTHNIPTPQIRQSVNNTVNRSQSLDRKHLEAVSSVSKRSVPKEYFKLKGDNTATAIQAKHEDDIIGSESRPPSATTNDSQNQTANAALHDHTYVQPMPSHMPLELQGGTSAGVIAISGTPPVSTGVGLTTTAGFSIGQNTGTNNNNLSGITQVTTTLGSVMTTCSTISSATVFGFGQHIHRQQQNDDDANSVISNESRTGHGDNDLGEETETAPEAEAEDDSITRCICDLTHDDGYMICCDKCSAWQHVDCMGIDRQNIPDEYLCEVCQPRNVDRARARNLQLTKRKEQSQLLINAQLNATNPSGVLMLTDVNGQLIQGNQQQDRTQPLSINTNTNHPLPLVGKKGKVLAGKKKELLKKNKKERVTSKRRESKRTTKRKTKTLNNSETNAADRYATCLRQWIENYELAMTNHYSPELRARLHAISKQQNLLQQITATQNKALKSCNSLENNCNIVPHAGGKILISIFDVQPNTPLVELRGKYMLTSQYKNQDPLVNMNALSTNCLQQTVKSSKIPGPFCFFYQFSLDGGIGQEICVDTRTYGNEARFVRRSCRPNAEIQHSFEKGTIHLYLVSLTNIMASTEITIRHEPHDLLAVENKNLNFNLTPTSTTCACGLTKDCPFGGVPVAVPTISKIHKKPYSNRRLSETKLSSLVKKNSSNVSRGRSTSSSGESNAGLLSPNTNFTPNLYNSVPISNLTNDSGVYTSSSSPTGSIPSPTNTIALISPPEQQPIPLMPTQEPITTAVVVPTAYTPPSEEVVPNNIVVSAVKSPQKASIAGGRKTPAKQLRTSVSEDSNQSSPIQSAPETARESRKMTREEKKLQAIVKAIEKMEKNEQRKQELKQIRSSSSGSTTMKRRNSSSPSPKRVKTQSISESGGEGGNNSVPPIQQAQRKNYGSSINRKRKRKGSKSYSSQNTIQNKRRRSRMDSNDSDMVTSEESTSLLSPPIPPTVPSGLTNSMPSNPDSAEDQMTLMTDLIESQIKNANCHEAGQPPMTLMLALSNSAGHDESNEQLDESTEHQISMNSDESENLKSSETSQELPADETTQEPSSTPPLVSSACLLVEAAVGPLESLDVLHSSDFKLPAKTKTKKSIMNDWLNQSNDYQQEIQQVNHHSHGEEEIHMGTTIEQQSLSVPQPSLSPSMQQKGLDTLVQAAATICDYRRTTSSPASFMVTPSHDEPQNLSIVAKRVEEFIHQTDVNFICSEDTLIKVESPSEHSLNSLHLPLQTNLNTSGSSSVKKRWLRQAISEETDENAAAALPASSPTLSGGQVPNGFTTPLKKRRVIRQCNDDEQINAEDLSFSKSSSDSSLSNEELTPQFNQFDQRDEKEEKCELQEDKVELKNEIEEIDDDVDVISSPSHTEILPGDNLVKIEPEDESHEIKVDVEKEESSSNEMTKKEESISEVVLEVKAVDDVKIDVKNDMLAVSSVKDGIEEIKKQEIQEVKEDELKNIPKVESNVVCEEVAEITGNQNENFEDFSDEIADIQKRLHSFHKENIERLQSRNRKSKIARSMKLAQTKTEQEYSESKAIMSEKDVVKIEPNNEFIKGVMKKENSIRHRGSKKRHLKFDTDVKNDKDHKNKNNMRKRSQDDSSNSTKLEDRRLSEDSFKDGKGKLKDLNMKMDCEGRGKIEHKISSSETHKIDDKQLQAALTIPNFNQNILTQNCPSNPIASYVTSGPALQSQNYDISSLLLAPPPPPPPTPPRGTVQNIHTLTTVNPSVAGAIQTNPLHLPYYNTIYGKFMDTNSPGGGLGSSNALNSQTFLSDYLDTKAKSYSTLGGYVSHSALFGLSNSKPGTGSLTNSTVGSAPASTMESTSTNSTAQSSSKTCSKIVTKTASSDPRLNPILTAQEPPPAPKRKLSINEYRKRKQQSTEVSSSNSSNPSESADSKGSSSVPNNSINSISIMEKIENSSKVINNNDSESLKIVEPTKVQFSPAPTLLEQQQEILCERLKTLKSKSSSVVMSSLGVSQRTSLPSITSSTSNSLSNVISVKDNMDTSKCLSLTTSSLDSVSTSPSPISSKESTPERKIDASPVLGIDEQSPKSSSNRMSSSSNSSREDNSNENSPK